MLFRKSKNELYLLNVLNTGTEMNSLFERQDAMLRTTSMDIVRNFMNSVNWSAQAQEEWENQLC